MDKKRMEWFVSDFIQNRVAFIFHLHLHHYVSFIHKPYYDIPFCCCCKDEGFLWGGENGYTQ